MGTCCTKASADKNTMTEPVTIAPQDAFPVIENPVSTPETAPAEPPAEPPAKAPAKAKRPDTPCPDERKASVQDIIDGSCSSDEYWEEIGTCGR